MNTLLLKLASLAAHAEEFLGPDGHDMDRAAVLGLLADPEVRRFLDDPANAVLLPLKRNVRPKP